MLETGTLSEEWKVLKELLFGPKGKKGMVCVSEPMTEVPSGEWDVMMRRGAGRVLDAMLLFQDDAFESERFGVEKAL